jgi:16S rRNA (cytidine1402-2'-O)-methyltransferase
MSARPGVLYVVATPIGNLEDLTFRALRTLKEVDLIAAEDTRRTSRLLAHYEIAKPLTSLREHNEARETPRLIEKLRSGSRIALVSDAGTPAIADPGARLVRAARVAGLRVVPIPGPSAVTAALSVSGLTTAEFTFLGFPPASGSARRDWFEGLSQFNQTIVFFEAPHRVDRTITELQQQLVNRPIYVHREITKIHEEYSESPIKNVNSLARGELTIVVGPLVPKSAAPAPDSALNLVGRLIESLVFNTEDAQAIASSVSGVPLATIRKAWKKRQILVKRQNETSA